MKTELDFFCEQWLSEWDFELAELVTLSDISDIKEHKVIICGALYDVKNLIIEQDNEDKVELLKKLNDVILWVMEL